jgi:hypothetical protein
MHPPSSSVSEVEEEDSEERKIFWLNLLARTVLVEAIPANHFLRLVMNIK